MDSNAACILYALFNVENVGYKDIPEGGSCGWMSTLHSHSTGGRKLGNHDCFERKTGSWEKIKAEDSQALIINLAEFWSWEARGKYIDVWKMLIKERSTLWFGRHPSAQAVWNLTAAWANGATNAFGETRHETQRRALMSLVDLSGTQDEWERWRERRWKGPGSHTW